MLNLPPIPPAVVDALVRDFTVRLRDVMEHATQARSRQIIDEIFASLRNPASAAARRSMQRADRQRQRVVSGLITQLLRDLEQATRLRVRDEVNREWATRARAAQATAATSAPRPRVRRKPEPPPPDPEQLKRDAEVARLRALLRPATEEVPPPPAPVITVPAPAPRPATPGEFLRQLEKEIQNTVPGLASLGAERCGAQIAAWAGQVREFRDHLSPEIFAVMRPAIRIFLEHLTELRTAMDATFVDALDAKWHPPDWAIYIEANRARAEGRAPNLAPDQLVAHHRAMLKALVQSHRRHVAEQAKPVIDAAAEVLPASDSQLRSAIRRHSPAWAAKAAAHAPDEASTEATAPIAATEVLPSTNADEPAAAETTPASTDDAAASSAADAPANEDDFARTWTK